MNDEFNLNELISDAKPKRPAKKIEGNLVRSDLTKHDVSDAKGKKLVKGRQRKTIFLPPELVEKIDAAAINEGAQIMDFYHWLISEAWQLYQDGKIRPSVTEVVKVVRGLAIDGYNE